MQIVAAALLATYFLFCLQHLVSDAFFSRLSQFTPTFFDALAGGFFVVTAAYFVLRSRSAKHERLSRSQIFWLVQITVFFTYLVFMSHIHDAANITPSVALTVGYLGTIGWTYTNYMNLRSQQRAHTMNVLMQLRTNAVLNEHRINFFRKFPPGKRLTPDDLPILEQERDNTASYNITSSNRSTSTWDSMQYMANLYEFICVGMRQGDLDEAVIMKSLRGILVGYFDTIRPFIDHMRHDRNGNLLPHVYENYVHYVDRFRIPPPSS